MATIATFNISLLPWQRGLAQSLPQELRAVGYRVDSLGRAFLKKYYRASDETALAGTIECAILTARELGCTEPPFMGDLRGSRCLYPASKKYLPRGKVFDVCDIEALLRLCLDNDSDKLGEVLTALTYADYGYALQSVRLPASNKREQWVYGVPATKKRWSLDHRFLLRVRTIRAGEQELIDAAKPFEQSRPDEVVASVRKPVYITDFEPGFYCAQIAARSIVGAFKKDPGQGKYFKHALPSQVTSFLQKYGINAPWRLWTLSKFESNLAEAICNGYMVNVVLYAQRRMHGQHNQVVCGFVRYDRSYYWMISDSQYAEREYDLPRGNVLLSTAELIRCFPKYLLWVGSIGAFVNIVFTE
ncbi:MAG TPA: hypothetical protein VHC68_01440 [Candidatus Paceibacterota bacterium]|nr:hypothetical protein [Candidatus Paceibacterota bacterium]